MFRRLTQWHALSRAERKALARALVLLPAMALALRCLGYRRTLALAQGGTAAPPDPSLSPEQLDELASASRMVDAAANHGIHRGNCLTKSLTLLVLMRRVGRRGRLVVGARRDADAFGAHAWVECGGVVINDERDVVGRYAAFGDAPVR